MTVIKHILDRKGHDVWTIRPDATVFDALETMASRDVGALVVAENGRVAGMFTERHYAREVFLKGRASPTTPIRDVMETDVIYVRPDRTVDECMAIMTEKRVRHLPVLEDGELTGLVSMGDLLKAVVDQKEFIIEELVNYIGRTR